MNLLLEFLQTHEEAFRSRSRLASLYSDFRFQRQINPDGYQANASVWLRALSAAANAGLLPAQRNTHHDHFILHSGEDLARALQNQELGRPSALGAVIDDAVRNKDLIPLTEFLGAKQSVYAKSWIPTPRQVVDWGLRQLGVVGGESAEDKLVFGDFVIKANVEAAAKTVLEQMAGSATSNTACIFSRDLFVSSVLPAAGLDALSSTDTSVLLTHLARDRSAITYASASGTIKFRDASESVSAPITPEDVTIASLRTLISSLETQTQNLSKSISDLEQTAREAVSRKQLTAARSALISKKFANTKMQQRTATLAQLEEVYAKIQQAHDQVELVRVMEASSQVLRSLNKQTGGVEKVQDVVEGLKEEMTKADEIQQVVNDVSAGTVDEGEVEDELEALERIEIQKQEEVERKEQEKREKEESEVTRKRLDALEPPPQKQGTSEEITRLPIRTPPVHTDGPTELPL